MDPLQRVRDTTAWVADNAQHVSISDAALRSIAAELVAALPPTRAADKAIAPMAEWDASVHFTDGTDLTVQYLLVLDALNFCFWPIEGLEYADLAVGLRSALLRDPRAFDATALAAVTDATLESWLGRPWPTLPQRLAAVREVGVGLLARYNGSAAELVRSTNGSASDLVRIVTQTFPSFQDHTVYEGRQVFLYKRAQIFVADVWGAFGGKGLGHFHDIGRLTMFADYRVPQLLRHWKALQYSEVLAARVDAKGPLAAGGPEEVEIRAATVQAVERLRDILHAEHGITTVSVHLDWLLWERGEADRRTLPPHHRTLTCFY